MADRDLYAVLGVSRDATKDQIRAAYRKLARKLHPDVNKADDAQSRFTEVQAAYDVLADPEKRARYDRYGSAAFDPAAAAGSRGATYSWSNVGGGSASHPFGDDAGDLGSMFDAFFGGRGRPSAGESRRSYAAEKGADIRATVAVPFETAALGGSVSVRTGRGDAARTIDVRVPPATLDGAKLRVRGEGADPARSGAPRGDLILGVAVKPHPLLRRGRPGVDAADAPLDLWLELPLTIAEAALGATVPVPTLDEPVDLKIAAGTGSHAKLRMKGRGLTGSDGQRGDLYAVIRIAVPNASEIEDDSRSVLEQFAAEAPHPRGGAAWPENG